MREADLEADRHHIRGMWTMISGSAAPDSQKLDHFYIQNPVGPGVIYMLWHGPSDSAVGVNCIARRDILVGGSIVIRQGLLPRPGQHRPDPYDNAMAASIIGLFKTESISPRGPWKNIDAVGYATLEWVD